MRHFKFYWTAASIAVLLAGCGGGGGGGDGSASTSNPTPSSTTAATLTAVSGTAATGAPFAGAVVSITDQTGAVVGKGTTNADGSYQVTLASGATPPFVIQAIRDDLTLASIVPDASSTTINITPITTLIASRLSISGDPTKLASELQTKPSLVSTATVTAKVNEVVALLQPLLTAVGSTVNPLTGTFSANGTGMDRALDSLLITFTAASATTTNIEISLKQQSTDGTQPAAVQFTNQTASLSQLSAPAPASLVPAGTTALIADLLQRLQACYALPVADRVVNPEAVSALASDVKAPACRTLFVNNDPAVYLSNGSRIGGADRSKPFNGFYRSGATGVKFDRGGYQFSRTNGDLVISYRTTDTVGGVQDQELVTRLVAADGKLHIIGNQYAYPGAVSAYHQLRTFVNQPAADHYSTGYVVNVPNNGQFSKVIVTSPKGKAISLVPSIGSANLVIPINNAPSGTNFIRVRGEFADAANTANPAASESGLVYDPDRPSNNDIVSFAANSVWRFDYYLTGNSSGNPDATQYYRTTARALSIPELKLRGLASLTADMVDTIKAKTINRVVPLGTTVQSVPFTWTVPTGAVAPTSLSLFGAGPVITGATRSRFDDGITVNSTARSGNVPCQPQSASDNHCAQVGSTTVFANGSVADGYDIRGSDGPGRTFSHFYATYNILP